MNNPNATDLQLALWGMHLVMVHDARDWAASNRDARLWALAVGWDDECYEEFRHKFGWTDETIASLKRRSAAVQEARGEFPEAMVQR